MQRVITIGVAVVTLGTAVAAAVLWFRSAMVETPEVEEPVASISDVPEVHIQTAVVNLNNLRTAMDRSANLNKKAAVWTGISALLGAATTIAGIW
jgi:transcription initiation factor TFIIIB Brf1 subunit/transcription initiation factor TFIIB